MIVVTLKGGLGNQMFQYAFGRGLAEAHGRRLCLDLSMLPTGNASHLRAYELSRFPISDQTLTVGGRGLDAEGSADRAFVQRVGKRIRRRLSPWLIKERDGEKLFVSDAIPRPIAVFVGYWQSHHYFSAIAEQIRRELTLRVPGSGPVARLLAETDGRNRIGVHVRRGDYVAVANVRDTHGFQSAAYFQRSVARISALCESEPVVIAVSDDPRWVADNIDFGVETLHAELQGPLHPTEALSLLSCCDHHVISNSTFSWWGAWLAEKPRQQVIYPSRWFVEREVDPSFRFPSHWKSQD